MYLPVFNVLVWTFVMTAGMGLAPLAKAYDPYHVRTPKLIWHSNSNALLAFYPDLVILYETDGHSFKRKPLTVRWKGLNENDRFVQVLMDENDKERFLVVDKSGIVTAYSFKDNHFIEVLRDGNQALKKLSGLYKFEGYLADLSLAVIARTLNWHEDFRIEYYTLDLKVTNSAPKRLTSPVQELNSDKFGNLSLLGIKFEKNKNRYQVRENPSGKIIDSVLVEEPYFNKRPSVTLGPDGMSIAVHFTDDEVRIYRPDVLLRGATKKLAQFIHKVNLDKFHGGPATLESYRTEAHERATDPLEVRYLSRLLNSVIQFPNEEFERFRVSLASAFEDEKVAKLVYGKKLSRDWIEELAVLLNKVSEDPVLENYTELSHHLKNPLQKTSKLQQCVRWLKGYRF